MDALGDMMKALRIAALATLMAGSAVGLASPAAAEPLGGTYAVTGEALQDNVTWLFTSCGPDCVGADGGGQLLRQGNVWAGTINAGCVTSIDENTLAGSYQCPMLPPFPIQLTKVG